MYQPTSQIASVTTSEANCGSFGVAGSMNCGVSATANSKAFGLLPETRKPLRNSAPGELSMPRVTGAASAPASSTRARQALMPSQIR